ncbi:integral membrane sensor signal transduction histidine kinase [Desulfovibrio sp. X2]|uniref:c-type heme family protein n=1 Tax=Desulfovibrio sp. X2 TaxID=941449 RepID=UPI000358F256|nr:DUF3365 domain-containing protein [Desulfovibrio sp. X2]EPR42098.1 integral membrane sensor signal transduction histidine kinase [Desulfovibrio sp. X2]
MKLPRPYSLQSRFLVGLLAASVIIGGLLFAGFSYHVRRVLENEVRDKAAMVLAQVDSVQRYERRILRPRMYEALPDTFIIEAMSSSYISRIVMNDMADESHTNLLYRRVAIGARNPRYEADALERGLIETFRKDPALHLWQGYKTIGGVRHFVMARPVVYQQSCLRCHGEIGDAPPELIALYGDRGFHHAENSIGGVDFVGLPVDASVARVQNAIWTYLLLFALGALLYFAATNVIFKRIVANNIRLLTTSFRRNFSDDKGAALVREVEQGDEIGEMLAGIDKLSDYLYETRQQIQGYATNLEAMVEERTRELADQAHARAEDVRMFVQLLAGANRSGSRPELWQATLPLIAERFDLERAAYVCTFFSNRHYAWPESAEAGDLPPDWIDLLTGSTARIEGDRAFIPVESTQGTAEGLLCLYRKPGRDFEEQDRAVLQAIGRQLGLAADNIMALESIVRHSANLRAIFEGITEPLLLTDTSGSPVVANEAARRLSMDLSGGVTGDGNVIGLLCEAGAGHKDCDIAKSIRLNEVISREVSLANGRSFALSIYPVYPAGPSQSGQAVVYVHETTQQKRLLAHMTHSEKMATVGKLASGLAHEINNPLGVILCYAELLKKAVPEGQLGEDVEVILKHTRQAQHVLKDLLSFARPKASTDQAVDLARAVRSIADVFRVQAERQGAAISVESDGDVPPVAADSQAIEHIMTNLIINALDALPEPGGRVRISVSHDAAAREAVVRVADDGPGIADEDRQYIFDPFYTTKEVNKGSGLGLSIVFGLMGELGGSVTAENGKDGGAVFTLRFPAAPGGAS